MQSWWSQRVLRERLAIIIGSSLLFLFLYIQMLLVPLFAKKNNLQQQIVTASQTLAWMQMADRQLAEINEKPNAQQAEITPVALLGILQQGIEQAGLSSTLKELKQASNGSIELHLQQAAFDTFITWFFAFNKTYAININQLAIQQTEQAGLVNVDISLESRG